MGLAEAYRIKEVGNIPSDAIKLSWQEAYDLTRQLSQKIQDSGQTFDAILVIPRGSYYPVNIIARDLDFTAERLIHACVTSYVSGSSERKTKFQTGQMPSQKDVEDKRILIIDEMCDTGETLKFISEWLKKTGVKSIKTGVLHLKPAANTTGFKPDWYVAETDKWIIYPWEIHENK